MSEYWVSKKRYFCKYCEIYIADDAPSRQHHENGLKHKGNVERFIRGIYKAGEKKKKDQEEERREMARVEQAARAAFAQDVSSGHAKANSGPVASSSSSASRKPATKPSNPFANYTTAAQLGITDPDVEKLEIRKTQGLVGEWQVIESTPAAPPDDLQEEETKPDISTQEADGSVAASSSKRPADAPPEDDTRTFKLRKKTAALGEIYDPGLIPIKLKKKEEKPNSVPEASAAAGSSSTTSNELPKWTAISLKPKDPTVAEPEGSSASLSANGTGSDRPVESRWAKVEWGQPMKEEEAAGLTEPLQTDSATGSAGHEPTAKTEEAGTSVKMEPDAPSLPIEPEPSTAGLFKKRKAPNGAGRGRRQL